MQFLREEKLWDWPATYAQASPVCIRRSNFYSDLTLSLEGPPEEKITAASTDTSEPDAQKIKQLELENTRLRDQVDMLTEKLRH